MTSQGLVPSGSIVGSIVGQEITPKHYGHIHAFPLIVDPESVTNGAIDWSVSPLDEVGFMPDYCMGVADIIAAAAGFGNTERDVRVDAGEVAADTMQFALVVSPPGPEARYHYRVTLKKESDGRFAGTYTGKFRGADIQGPAEAAIKPARQMAADYVPLQPGEHPRLLFRKADVPALRKKAETPFGKLALEKLPASRDTPVI